MEKSSTTKYILYTNFDIPNIDKDDNLISMVKEQRGRGISILWKKNGCGVNMSFIFMKYYDDEFEPPEKVLQIIDEVITIDFPQLLKDYPDIREQQQCEIDKVVIELNKIKEQIKQGPCWPFRTHAELRSWA